MARGWEGDAAKKPTCLTTPRLAGGCGLVPPSHHNPGHQKILKSLRGMNRPRLGSMFVRVTYGAASCQQAVAQYPPPPGACRFPFACWAFLPSVLLFRVGGGICPPPHLWAHTSLFVSSEILAILNGGEGGRGLRSHRRGDEGVSGPRSQQHPSCWKGQAPCQQGPRKIHSLSRQLERWEHTQPLTPKLPARQTLPP